MNKDKKSERIDLLLKELQIIKSRERAKYACEEGVVFVNDEKVKPSHKVFPGDVIRIILKDRTINYEILDIPTSKNVRKSDVINYYKTVGDNE